MEESEILGRHVSEFVAPEARELSRESVRRKLAGEQPLEVFERVIKKPDGTRLVLEIHETALRDAHGRIKGIRSFLLNITKRVEAENALRESQERYRQLVEHASDIIFTADLDGHMLFFNPTTTELLGYPPEELRGRNYLDLISPDFRKVVQDFYSSQIADRVPHTYFEFPVTTHDGRTLWLGQNLQLVNEKGRLAGVQAIARDITAQRRAEEEQKQAREDLERRVWERTEQLELANDFLRREMEERRHAEDERRKLEAQVQHAQRLESLGVLAGGIAHDFNNLLASVMGYASLAMWDLPPDSPVRPSLEQVISAARTGATLTDQMLAYSGHGKYMIEPLDVSRLIEEVTRLAGSAISKKASLHLQLAEDLPQVEGDAAQLHQVIMNLITNASDALGDNPGTIRVSTGVQTVGAGALRDLQSAQPLPPGEYVTIEVADTGTGMDEATRARIFDPFFTTKFTGRGLGLAAVLGIVRSHRGSIQVKSEPGRGSQFCVFLPRAGERHAHLEAAAPQAGAEPPITWRGKALVLVADDEPAVRDLARIILESVGLTVVTAGDGVEALKVFEERPASFDAVLLDLTMPGMDGAEVFRHVCRRKPDVKAVLCSGYNENEVIGHFAAEKPAAFVRKPYMPAELIGKLRSVLEAK